LQLKQHESINHNGPLSQIPTANGTTSSAGNAYVTGDTLSSEATFPIVVGPILTFKGVRDAFVVKVNPTGTGLVYAGYLGGAGEDAGVGIAVDSVGNAYISGWTESSDFPVHVGPSLTYHLFGDAFVAKINPTGTGLVYAGYIGGAGDDDGGGIAVDSSGNAYITGGTGSTEATFPVVEGPDLTYNGGDLDAFVAKVKADGTGLVYCGYIGGSALDGGGGIAVDSSGNAYITGGTGSTEATFPVVEGPDLTYNGGSFDAFVAKVKTDGNGLIYAGYIGGDNEDSSISIAVDGSGNAYIAGSTFSTEATFPVVEGPDLTHNGDLKLDAFVAKVNVAGTALLYTGYIGGSDQDQGNGIAVDSAGNAYVSGITFSTEATFPTTVGPDLAFNGGVTDAFVAKVGEADTSLEASLLPVSRSVSVGTLATAWASIINAGAVTALNCGIAPRSALPATFYYQTTDCATNQLTGSPDTPVDIPAGETACFLFGLTPSSPIAPINAALDFKCTNSGSAPTYPEVNTFLFSASTTPTPDIIASGLPCPSDDAPVSAVNLPGPDGDNAVGFATTNVGVEGTITVTVDTGSVALPVFLAVCQTNPQTGECINPVIPAPSVTLTMAAGAQPTFSIFALGHGNVPTDLAKHRIFLRFRDSNNIIRGATSVAVRTHFPACVP
jgi:hypothetical protein